MSPELWKRVKPLFHAASEMKAEARGPYLARVCAGDRELRREVEILLAGHDSGSAVLDKSPVDLELIEDPRPSGPALKPGEVLAGRFQVLRFVQSGGMGEVYEANDLDFGGSVALKTLRPALVHDETSLGRFKREVRLAKRVSHKNLCRIFDGGWHRGGGRELAFLTMEFLPGRTLAAHLADFKPIRGADALPVLRQIAEGLAALHEAAIIHRDLKPGNVILVPAKNRPARAVITDFGLARLVDVNKQAQKVTKSAGFMIGTPEYMAPEQLSGDKDAELGPFSDIYSFGTVAYEMLCGRLPFNPEAVGTLIVQKLTKTPPSPREIIPEISTGWEKFILGCLEREPGQRIQTAAELLEWLQQLEAEPEAERLSLTPTGPAATTGPAALDGGDVSQLPTEVVVPPDSGDVAPVPPKPRPKLWIWTAAGGAAVAATVAVMLQITSIRTPMLGSLCGLFPGSAWFCALPEDKDVAILPIEVEAATGTDRSIGRGMARFLEKSLYRLYPNKQQYCVHTNQTAHLLTEKLALSATLAVEDGKISMRGQIRGLSQESLASFSGAPLLRTVDAEISLDKLEDSYQGFPVAIGEALDIDFPGDIWAVWLAERPRNAEAFRWYLSGVGALESDDEATAAASFEDAIRVDPSYAAAAAGLGDAYRARWDHSPQDTIWRDRAANSYRRALGLEDNSTAANLGLGDLAYRSGNVDVALNHYRDALETDPDDYDCQIKLSEAYELAGKPDEVERVGRFMTERRPNCYRGYNHLAGFYEKHARYLDSERQLMKVISLTPWNARAYDNLALVHIKQGRYTDAIEVAAQGANLPEPSSRAFSNLGRAYLYLGCASDALVNLKHAVSIDPSYFAIWTNLAEAYARIEGHSADSEHAFTQVETLARAALQRDPGRLTARTDLALSLANLGRPAEAIHEIDTALKFAPERRETLLQAAVVYELAGKREQAFRMLARGLEGGLSLPEIEQLHWLKTLRDNRQYAALSARSGVKTNSDTSRSTRAAEKPPCPNNSQPGLGIQEFPNDLTAQPPAQSLN